MSSLSSLLPHFAALMLFGAIVTTVSNEAFAQTDVAAKENDPLTTYQGKNRVILVFGPAEDDANVSKQMDALKNKEELDDRQIVVLPILASDKAAGKSLPYLQKKYNDGGSNFGVVLIGKDGNDAFKSVEPVPAEALYAKIDAMPMRKDEIKEKSVEADKTRGESKTDKQKDN